MSIKLYELCTADENIVFSPHCWKIRMALWHKGLDFETVPLGFSKIAAIEGGEGRLVLVLVDGEAIIEESYKIALHLEEKYPDAPSLFNGEGGKALTQLVIGWSQTQLHPVVTRLVLMNIFDALNEEDKAHFRITREKRFDMSLEEFAATQTASPTDIQTVLIPLETALADQPFIGGQTPLFADYVVFGAIQWLRVIRGQSFLKKDSRADKWFETLLDLYDGKPRATALNN